MFYIILFFSCIFCGCGTADFVEDARSGVTTNTAADSADSTYSPIPVASPARPLVAPPGPEEATSTNTEPVPAAPKAGSIMTPPNQEKRCTGGTHLCCNFDLGGSRWCICEDPDVTC